MRSLLSCCLTASLLVAASTETEVKAVLARQEAAWNRADLNAFMESYLHSPDIVFVGKQVTRGWQSTLERYQKSYPTPASMGKLTFSEIEVRPLGKDYASVLGRFHLERTATGGGNASGRYTLIAVRTKQGWKLIHDHTTAD